MKPVSLICKYDHISRATLLAFLCGLMALHLPFLLRLLKLLQYLPCRTHLTLQVVAPVLLSVPLEFLMERGVLRPLCSLSDFSFDLRHRNFRFHWSLTWFHLVCFLLSSSSLSLLLMMMLLLMVLLMALVFVFLWVLSSTWLEVVANCY